jgi:hypothetical protein
VGPVLFFFYEKEIPIEPETGRSRDRSSYSTRPSGIRLCITPIVVTELQLLSRSSSEPISALARKALGQLRSEWKIEPLGLDKLDRDIAKEFANVLIAKELIPLTELNDAIVLAEAAVAGVPFVISSDHHLVSIEPSDLAAIHISKRLPLVYVLHPAQARRSLERFN